MKTRFIVNLRSNKARLALDAVRQFAGHRGAGVVLTERAQHASDLARQALAEGCDLIVAVGGDGTMNEVASALVGTSAILGLIPCGSGNGLGRHLGIHGSVGRAISLLETGTPRLIDTGLADGHPFVTVAGLGFEAEISQKFNQLERRGFARYLSTSAGAFYGWQPLDCTVVCGDRRDRVRAFTLAVANSNQYGNNARIAPAARVDDGLLDLCVIPPITVFNAAPLLSSLFAGLLPRLPGVIVRRSERFTVERGASGLIHTDGEVFTAGAVVDFQIRPASLRIMAPGRAR